MKITSLLQTLTSPASRAGRARTPYSLWVVGLLALACAGCGTSPRVVLYCAQDREFAEQTLSDFTAQTGLPVAPKFDTEADKSVSLYLELLNERRRPRCDVFWNNEILSTIRLQRRGLLEPYDSPAARPFPASAQASDHTWTAFAARARVLLVNTQLLPNKEHWPRSLLDLTRPRWKGRVAMAKPQFGTTATQAACLFEVLGVSEAEDYYRSLAENAVQIVPGNKQVAEAVSQGQAAVGVTDTDDAIAEVRAGRPVAIVYPDRDGQRSNPRLGTLFIPNTVALIRGGPNPTGGRQLIDYLLSPVVETALAESASCQIPLNPEVKLKKPLPIETPQTIKAMQVDWGKAAELWDQTQEVMVRLFAR
jgi:iron(III) transport system substrate-binding protein